MIEKGVDLRAAVDAVYRSVSRRVLATLVRLLGDLDLAEDALHEAFAAAMRTWPREGVPANPRAWLVSAGRFRAIDAIRKRSRGEAAVSALGREAMVAADAFPQEADGRAVEDDRLRLIFLCCHPVNPIEAQVALTLREVCDLTTEQIAAAYLVEVPTLAKRIVRAKARLREERITYEVPAAELSDRLQAVLQVVYLVFNEGYSASSGRIWSAPSCLPKRSAWEDCSTNWSHRSKCGACCAHAPSRIQALRQTLARGGSSPPRRAGPVAVEPASHR